ncbi:MAG: hypothetical protein RLZZ436_86, partial [Planctomycetota bacterium]
PAPADKPGNDSPPNPFQLISTTINTGSEKTIVWDWKDPGDSKPPDTLPLLLSGSDPQLQIIPWAPFNKHLAESSASNSIQIVIESNSEQPGTWDVNATNGQKPLPVGQIHLKPADRITIPAATHVLEFQWTATLDPDITTIARWCPLELKAEGTDVFCVVRSAEVLTPYSTTSFLAGNYAEAIALDHDRFRAIGTGDLSNQQLGIEIQRSDLPEQRWETRANGKPLQIPVAPDGTLQTAPVPADNRPAVAVEIRLQPPSRNKGEAVSLQIKCGVNATIPRIGLERAAENSRGDAHPELFTNLLKRKPQQLFSADTLQLALTQIHDFSDVVALPVSLDLPPDDLYRQLNTDVGKHYRDAAIVCSTLSDKKLPALIEDLQTYKSSIEKNLDAVTSSQKAEPEKQQQQDRLKKELAQTTDAIKAAELLVSALSAQHTWFSDNREPHLQQLRKQIIGLRSTSLRIVFFADFPDPQAPPNSQRGRVRLMEVSVSDAPEVTP